MSLKVLHLSDLHWSSQRLEKKYGVPTLSFVKLRD